MTSIIFPGQGSQYAEMAKDFYDHFKESREIFDLVSNITDIDLKDIIFNNSNEILNQPRYTQLAIFCASLSIFKALEKNFAVNKLNIKTMILVI